MAVLSVCVVCADALLTASKCQTDKAVVDGLVGHDDDTAGEVERQQDDEERETDDSDEYRVADVVSTRTVVAHLLFTLLSVCCPFLPAHRCLDTAVTSLLLLLLLLLLVVVVVMRMVMC